MKELDAQTMVCKAVRAYGGFATKLSHRFLVGVPDLLVKLPCIPAMLIEVKWRLRPVSPIWKFRLDVTPLQRKFMYGASEAGMCCAVASILTRGKERWLCLYELSVLEDDQFTVDSTRHDQIRSPQDVVRVIRCYQENW